MAVATHDLIVIGGGPAGFTAGIYAGRAGLDAVILDAGACGGQAATSPMLENYPGFEAISGYDLMSRMKEHAQKYARIVDGARVEHIRQEDAVFHINASEVGYRARAVIFATGAEYRKLGVPGEERLLGSGVSYCATCDGMFFRGRKVAVVGGGNSGATEALHLKHIGADVTLVHRRESLRAEQVLQDRLKAEGIRTLLNVDVLEIAGAMTVTGLKVRDRATGEERTHEFGGVFVSVGVEPSTALARSIGVEVDGGGFIRTGRDMRTSVRMAYAAGDVTGGLRQVVTACAGGAVAAMSAYEDVRNPYWK